LQLLEFEILPTGSLEIAIAAAENHRLLRSKGFIVRKTLDCWIATFCIRINTRCCIEIAILIRSQES
jgi:predicted nucleic acid-binding protein